LHLIYLCKTGTIPSINIVYIEAKPKQTPFKLGSHTMKSLQTLQMRMFVSLYWSHCTETLQSHCYNNGSDRFSCNDDFIVCDRGSYGEMEL